MRQNVGIEDWLAYIYHASFVITDSFHGTCFSLIFEKQFICIMNKARGISRFETLFSKLNLRNAAVNDALELIAALDREKVDFHEVNGYLQPEIIRSLNWLKNALKKEPMRRN